MGLRGGGTGTRGLLWLVGAECRVRGHYSALVGAAFQPTEAMFNLFTKDMYEDDAGAGGGEERDMEEVWEILDEADGADD